MPEEQSRLEEQLRHLRTLVDTKAATKPLPRDFNASKKAKKESTKLFEQKGVHREKLLNLVRNLSILSFVFLVAIISFQMWKRTGDPQYQGVSDMVINIITGGVFGEVIAVVAVIAKEVWKD